MSFETRARLAAGSKWSYVFPVAGVAIAAVSVYIVEPLILHHFGSDDTPDQEERHQFYRGAHLLVAKAAIKKWYWHKIAFRFLEVLTIIAFFHGLRDGGTLVGLVASICRTSLSFAWHQTLRQQGVDASTSKVTLAIQDEPTYI